jgi:hypothetical protein
MTFTTERIISPTGRRIYIIDGDANSVVTGSQLVNTFGWTRYTGPAQADTRGWTIHGTDPALHPTYAEPRKIRP